MSETNPTNQAVIENFSHDGRGVITKFGKKILIDGVLPGETVNFEYTKRHRRFDEAKITTVVHPAPERVPAICPNFLNCGGCSYQHVSPQTQLEYKHKIVTELLQHVGGKVKIKKWLPALQAKTSGYRTKARLGIKYVIKKQKLLIGFREKSSSFITEMDTCKILHPKLDNLIKPMSNLIMALSNFDQIPQVEFAMGDDGDYNIALVIRHLSEFTENDKYLLMNFAQAFELNLLLQPGGPDTVHVLHGSDKLFYELQYQDTTIKYNFHPQDFTQVNLQLNQLMIDQAINLLDLKGDETVLDLFCGLGNFSLPFAKVLASNGGKLIGIEGCSKMTKQASANAELNGITNAHFECADLYNAENLAAGTSNLVKILTNKIDAIILDPPRSGAAEVLPYIAKSKVAKILYISCNPATFARDVGILCNDYGYKLASVGLLDMFPHTKHVETMGILYLKG